MHSSNQQLRLRYMSVGRARNSQDLTSDKFKIKPELWSIVDSTLRLPIVMRRSERCRRAVKVQSAPSCVDTGDVLMRGALIACDMSIERKSVAAAAAAAGASEAARCGRHGVIRCETSSPTQTSQPPSE